MQLDGVLAGLAVLAVLAWLSGLAVLAVGSRTALSGLAAWPVGPHSVGRAGSDRAPALSALL